MGHRAFTENSPLFLPMGGQRGHLKPVQILADGQGFWHVKGMSPVTLNATRAEELLLTPTYAVKLKTI